MAKKEAVSLFTMLGADENLFVVSRGVEYKIRALDVTEVVEFKQDNLPVLGFTIMGEEEQEAKLEKWLKRCLKDAQGEAVTIEKIKAVPWSVVDVRKFIMKLMDISG